MNFVLLIAGSAAAIAVLVGRALALDEIKGRVQRHITASLDATIDMLPDELQAEWADEWRAELAAVITMPLTAMQLVRGVRRSAHELLADPALAPAGIDDQIRASKRIRVGVSIKRAQRVQAGIAGALSGADWYVTCRLVGGGVASVGIGVVGLGGGGGVVVVSVGIGVLVVVGGVVVCVVDAASRRPSARTVAADTADRGRPGTLCQPALIGFAIARVVRRPT